MDRVRKLLVFEELEGESEEIDRFAVLEEWAKSVDELWMKVVDSAALVDWTA